MSRHGRRRRSAGAGKARPPATPESGSSATQGKPERLTAPTGDYTDPQGAVLRLRGSLTPATRREYAATLAGAGRPAATREDTWHRAVEFLFERLAVSWEIAGAPPIERQRELLARLRAGSSRERAWVREVLREHCAEHFPDVKAP